MWVAALKNLLAGKTEAGPSAPDSLKEAARCHAKELSLPELAALAGHRSGFFREAAVRELAGAPAEITLPVLFERLNDWVPEVRRTATKVLEPYLRLGYVPEILASLDAVLALERKSRHRHGELLRRLDALLAQPGARSEVCRFFPRARGQTARHLLALAMAWQEDDAAKAMIALAAKHKDYLVRLDLAAACAEGKVAGMEASLAALARDHHPKIRQRILAARWSSAIEDGLEETRREILTTALLDSSPAVRSDALAARQGGFDLQGFLQRRMEKYPSGDRTDAALISLIGTFGDKRYLDLVRRADGDPRPAVRRAVLAAWVALARETAEEPVLKALAAEGKIRALALRLIRRGDVLIAGNRLLGLVEADLAGGNLQRAVENARLLHRWDRLECLAAAFARAVGEKDRQTVLEALRVWTEQQHYGLSILAKEHQARLRRILEESGIALQAQNQPELAVLLAKIGFGIEG